MLPEKQRDTSIIINDQPIGEDYLDYVKYSKAITKLVMNDATNLPLTFGIYADWGSGKSFLMNKIKKELEDKEKEKNIFVNFNAWSYSGSDVLWAGLVKELVEATEKKHTKAKVRCFRHFVYPWNKKSTSENICSVIYTVIRFIILIVSLSLTSLFQNEEFVTTIFEDVAIYSTIAISIATIIPSIVTFFIDMFLEKGTQIVNGAKKIKEKVGFMGDIKDEVELLCEFAKTTNCKFAVFIDDLDRCPPEKIIETLDAIMLLLANLDFPFLTFIAIDPRIVIKAIESSYNELMVKSGINGLEYLDKLIQIPFNIPTPSPKTKDRIASILIREKEEVMDITFEHLSKIKGKYYIFIQRDREVVKTIQLPENNYTSKINSLKSFYLKLKYAYKNTRFNMLFDIDIDNNEYVLKFIYDLIDKIMDDYNQYNENDINENNQYISFESILANNNLVEYYNKYKLKKVKVKNNKKEENIYDNFLKLSNKLIATDENFCNFGNYLIESNSTICIETEKIKNEKIMIDYFDRLKKFMNNKLIKYSPYKENLNTIFSYFQKFTKKCVSYIPRNFSEPEIAYIHRISDYFDGNCRRNKRIINIYILTKNLLENKIFGWYSESAVTLYNLKIILKFIILFEQWPFKMAILFYNIEKSKENLISLDKKTKYKNIDNWLEGESTNNIHDVLKYCDKEFLYNDEFSSYIRMDYNYYLFEKFHLEVEPLITVEYFYLCIPYIFNINYCIKNKIEEVSNIAKIKNINQQQ